jgi:hypothetical protein
MARLLPGTALRVRRGRRHDLPQIRAVLGAPAVERLERVYRRILADLGTDVYVAEDTGGEIVGLVSVVYTRSLARGGLSALLDGARARSAPAGPLLEGLVAFAAWVDAGDAELRATLLARGYRAGELFVAELGGPS